MVTIQLHQSWYKVNSFKCISLMCYMSLFFWTYLYFSIYPEWISHLPATLVSKNNMKNLSNPTSILHVSNPSRMSPIIQVTQSGFNWLFVYVSMLTVILYYLCAYVSVVDAISKFVHNLMYDGVGVISDRVVISGTLVDGCFIFIACLSLSDMTIYTIDLEWNPGYFIPRWECAGAQ